MAEEERITLRLPADLHKALAEHARRDQRSLNGQIVYLLRQATAPPTSGGPDIRHTVQERGS